MIKIVKICSLPDYKKLVQESLIPVVVEITSPIDGTYGLRLQSFTNTLFSSELYEEKLIYCSIDYLDWSKLISRYIALSASLPELQGLPALLFYRNGQLQHIISGLDVSLGEITQQIQRLVTATTPQVLPDYTERRVGSTIVREYTDGRSETIMLNGTKVMSYPDGRVETTYPDGRVKTVYPDSVVGIVYPDGHREITYPDRSVELIQGDGTHTVIYPDGHRIITHPDGTEEYVDPALEDPLEEGSDSDPVEDESI